MESIDGITMKHGNKGVEDTEIIDVFASTDDPVLAAKEVADEIGMSRQGAGQRLRKLVDRGELQRKRPGHRTAVYWLPDDS
jgi:Fic family protein